MKPSAFELLLHLAGQFPDELLELARDRLAAGDEPEVGRLVRFGQLAYRSTAPPDYYDAARALFAAAGVAEENAATLVFPRTPVPPYEFWPVPPGGCDSGRLDHAITARCGQVPGLLAVRRAWRTSVGDSSWPGHARVIIAEVAAGADPLAARELLRAAAGPAALVEVLPAGTRVPGYHERARTASALLWSK
ncbi:hypothetical protein [Lentzea sp. NBRC 105346]|uniref:hypothetical protein n=1 Tax=Lentzea sp. NBRC 105346 TaxID=3032205 RepID=UPI00255516E5|nr:hypothetical protein [Lentzea sp. NBRC 105346]